MSKNDSDLLILQEAELVAKAWNVYGGSFLNNLGKVLLKCNENVVKDIRCLWEEEWDNFVTHFVKDDDYKAFMGFNKSEREGKIGYDDSLVKNLIANYSEEKSERIISQASIVVENLPKFWGNIKSSYDDLAIALSCADNTNTVKIYTLIEQVWLNIINAKGL